MEKSRTFFEAASPLQTSDDHKSHSGRGTQEKKKKVKSQRRPCSISSHAMIQDEA